MLSSSCSELYHKPSAYHTPCLSFAKLYQHSSFSSTLLHILVTVGLVSTLVRAQELSDAQIDTLSARLAEAAQASWELGTRAQAILELNATRYSVFTDESLPPPSTVQDDMTEPMVLYLDIAKQILGNWNGTADGPPQPLMPDGSAADPASNGVTVLIANWTGTDGGDYAAAARSQLEYLYSSSVPKTSDGAFSHRTDQVQLWSDFVFMVPPFLAYYGALSLNRTLLEDAYSQCKLYRSYLRDNSTGLWKHVLLGVTGNDPGFWSTGNGWAAAGMLRVHATIQNSQYSNTMKKEKKDLANWVGEIHQAMYAHVDSTNIFTNYVNQPATAPGNFYDSSGTALLAATVFRASLELGKSKYLSYAGNAWSTLFNSTSSDASSNSSDAFNGFTHFTSDGWLTPVVNPSSYGMEGNKSAEGQAFVVMLQAARRDWTQHSDGSSLGASRWCVLVAVMVMLLV